MILEYADDEIRVLVDLDDCSYFVEKKFGNEWMLTGSYTAQNLRVLSECLSDDLGYSRTVQMLTEHQIPKNSILWTLNHKGGFNHWRQS